MKKALIVLVCVGLLAGVANASDIGIFLGESAVEVSDGVTPEFTCDDAPKTLYIWADLVDGDRWIGISMNVDFDGAGAVLVETSELYDRYVPPATPLLPSWNPGSDFSFVGDNYAAVAAITEQGLGGALDVPTIDNGGRGYYLIGELTIDCLDPFEATDLYLTVGASGIARAGAVPGEDDIYFGFGDDPVASDATGVRTALPEAIIAVPEPASLLLLALVGLALRRR
jgi:hypothetical protein